MTLLGCQSPGPVLVRSQVQAPSAKDYAQILAAHTRRAHVYDFFADKVDLRATYHSSAFKQAFRSARAGFYGRTAELIDLYLQDRKPPASALESLADVVKPFNQAPEKPDPETLGSESFLVAFYVSDQAYRALDADDSIWDVTLTVDGGPALKPVKIDRLRRDPSLDQIYTYLNKLDQVYWLRFAKIQDDGRPTISDNAKHMTLRVVSKLADARLQWDFLR